MNIPAPWSDAQKIVDELKKKLGKNASIVLQTDKDVITNVFAITSKGKVLVYPKIKGGEIIVINGIWNDVFELESKIFKLLNK